MKLVCPGCGAVCSAEAWINDAEARQALKIVAELPESVSRRALPYLALFRPMTGRALKWQTALKHLHDLELLVREPYVQWDGRPARPNDSRFWGQAMDRICEQPPKQLPLKSHGYLRAIVYEIADEADRKAESIRHQAEASGRIRSDPRVGAVPEPAYKIDWEAFSRSDPRVGAVPERANYEEMVALRRRKAADERKGTE